MPGTRLDVVHTTVFAASPGGGNPCPVVLDADRLSAEEMRSVAAHFGHESAFVVEPADDAADVRLRYFVPNHEMEMCVHATIAAVTVLRQRGRIADSVRVQTALGIIHAETERGDGSPDGCDVVQVEQRAPQSHDVTASEEELAGLLGVDVSALDPRWPVRNVSTARAKLMVAVRDHHVLDSLQPRWEELWAWCDAVSTTGVYAFTTSPRTSSVDAEARQFPVRAGYPEDPATGVAACALGAHLASADLAADGIRELLVGQGHAMGRPSVIRSRVLVEGRTVVKTWVAGAAEVLAQVSMLRPGAPT